MDCEYVMIVVIANNYMRLVLLYVSFNYHEVIINPHIFWRLLHIANKLASANAFPIICNPMEYHFYLSQQVH